MIPLILEEKILRLYFGEKWPIGTIAKQCGVHHSTVRRVLNTQGATLPPNVRPSIVDPYLAFIQETLKDYPQLPSSRLHRMVVERGYPGGPDHFRRLISGLRPRKPAEAYMRLRTLPADEAQMDWGHFGQHTIGRATRAISAFVMVLSWSRMPFVRFFYDQRMSAFLTGHVEAFRFFKGVPRRVLYDNLKSVVLSRHLDAIQFNPNALALASHYGFEPRPVAIRRGNEKGRVERTIRYLRTSFWPALTWSDLDDLNEKVRDWSIEIAGRRTCPEDDTLDVLGAWRAEQPKMIKLQSDFPAHELKEVSVGKQPYVRFDKNDYSIPYDHVRRHLTVIATPKNIRVLDGDKVIAEHQRSFDKKAQIEDPDHLQGLLDWKREARAGRGMDALHQAAPSAATFLEGAAKRGHNLGSAVAALLRLMNTWGQEALEEALVEAIEADSLYVAAVKQVLSRKAQEEQKEPPLPVNYTETEQTKDLHVTPHKLSSYDLGDVDA